MKTVAEIAQIFGFDVTALNEQLEFARGMHDNAADRTIHKQLVEFADAVSVVKNLYEKLSVDDTTGEPYFEMMPEAALAYLNEPETTKLVHGLYRNAEMAADESTAMHRKGGRADLFALDFFTVEIGGFWDTHRDERFGCEFKGKGNSREPDNDASRFLWACVQWLDKDKKYKPTHAEACMKRLNKDARRGGRKEPPAPVKVDPSKEEYQQALNKFLLGSQKSK